MGKHSLQLAGSAPTESRAASLRSCAAACAASSLSPPALPAWPLAPRGSRHAKEMAGARPGLASSTGRQKAALDVRARRSIVLDRSQQREKRTPDRPGRMQVERRIPLVHTSTCSAFLHSSGLEPDTKYACTLGARIWGATSTAGRHPWRLRHGCSCRPAPAPRPGYRQARCGGGHRDSGCKG